MTVVTMRTGPNRGLSAGQEKVHPEEKVKKGDCRYWRDKKNAQNSKHSCLPLSMEF